jgi:hypothetical protein
MQTEQPSQANGYIRSILQDGAKPFRYRCRVHSLLGSADRDEETAAFSPASPPVGFKYVDHPLPEAMGPDLACPHNMRQSGAQSESEAAQKPTEMSVPSRAVEAPAHQRREDPCGLAEPPGEARDQTSLAIPGVSLHPQHFHLSAPAQTHIDDGLTSQAPLADRHVQLLPEAELPSVRKITEGHLYPSTRETVSKARHQPTAHRPGPVETTTRDQGTPDEPPWTRATPSRPDLNAVEHLRADTASGVGRTPAALRGAFHQSTAFSREYQTSASVQSRITQLRDATRAWAAPLAPPHREPTHNALREPSTQTLEPEPTVQRMVVVKQPVWQPRAPRAFWERRYLSRRRLRPLR